MNTKVTMIGQRAAPATSLARRSGRVARCTAQLALLACLAATSIAAVAAPTEVHGALDAYAGHGVAMAWGVLRGKDEATTMVVVRVGADAARYRALDVVGIDPFTRKGAPMAARVALDGASVLVRIPRARFAELPQTEWRFLRDGAAPQGEGSLVVFYRGVPDTTPEFDDEAKLEASLVERIARARRAAADPPP